MPATTKSTSRSRGASSLIDHRHIVVKFEDSLQLPRYEDKIEKYPAIADSPEWKEISGLAPGATFRRIYRVLTPEEINKLSEKAVARSDGRYKPPQFLKNYLLDLPPRAPVDRVLGVLRDWTDIDRAYPAPQAIDPKVDASDDTQAKFQWYLDAAPLGVDARYAWEQPGGDGAKQEFIDVEQGWMLNHKDLCDAAGVPRAQLLGGVSVPFSSPHGTAVLGIICATDNAFGCVGIACNTPTVGVISHGGFAFNIPEAIKISANRLTPGGVILLEVTLREREASTLLPAEIDPLTFEEIQLATALGHVVVEAAGNGNFPLDTYQDRLRKVPAGQIFNRLNPAQFLDSGAIMVGSGWRLDENARAATPWSRRLDSNYGSRIDCFAWGDSVQTTGTTPTNPLNDYDSNFNGTSSAAAIVAGAAISVQGMAQHQAASGSRLNPAIVRQYLSDPAINTPTIQPPVDMVGVMPNLAAIGRQRLELGPPGPDA